MRTRKVGVQRILSVKSRKLLPFSFAILRGPAPQMGSGVTRRFHGDSMVPHPWQRMVVNTIQFHSFASLFTLFFTSRLRLKPSKTIIHHFCQHRFLVCKPAFSIGNIQQTSHFRVLTGNKNLFAWYNPNPSAPEILKHLHSIHLFGSAVRVPALIRFHDSLFWSLRWHLWGCGSWDFPTLHGML